MLKKSDIDLRVARALGRTTPEIAAITACFLRAVVHAIVEEEEVRLASFGKFFLRKKKNTTVAHLKVGTFRKGESARSMSSCPPHKFFVSFQKADSFREIIWDRFGKPSEEDNMSNEENMDKYGVDEGTDQEELEKKALQGCPIEGCSKKPTRHGSVLSCPTHGTEPFERSGR